jgi:hypothetical protein
MIETVFVYLMTYWPLTTGAVIAIAIGLGGGLLSEYRERKKNK